ncbi:MbtH protein [Micromonospora sp. Llam0]|uniref:MbtH family protein n=1 Tax=Micromonospora sp. Llam0 TaxID=2485143 RepID=UPI000F478D2B|nr:MbtH family protein [Micromonospora sp. Llam0]ROO60557.1 MbtH protein [Micromonospora sp. Llam0]
MPHAFDDEGASFLALANQMGQYSLWPAFAVPPPGWAVVNGPSSRTDCLAYVEHQWTDLRPEGSGIPR